MYWKVCSYFIEDLLYLVCKQYSFYIISGFYMRVQDNCLAFIPVYFAVRLLLGSQWQLIAQCYGNLRALLGFDAPPRGQPLKLCRPLASLRSFLLCLGCARIGLGHPLFGAPL